MVIVCDLEVNEVRDMVKRLLTINKDVLGIIDRIVWKLRMNRINEDYESNSCVFVPNTSNTRFKGCRSIGIYRRQVNYRLLKDGMRTQDRVITSFLVKNARKINDFTPDKMVGEISRNYAYTATTYLRDWKRSLNHVIRL